MKYTDYAKRDEIKANLIAEQINQQVDSEMDIKKRIKQQRLVEASMNNQYKMLQAEKTKLENLRAEEANHPAKTNEIYATIPTQEIKQGMSPEQQKDMDKSKAR